MSPLGGMRLRGLMPQGGEPFGAVPHVLVNDPTQGCGICIERMPGAAES